jgi:hypothetical protein
MTKFLDFAVLGLGGAPQLRATICVFRFGANKKLRTPTRKTKN